MIRQNVCEELNTGPGTHRTLYSVAINVIAVTSGPLEDRGRCGRWASGCTDGTAFHFTGRDKQAEELWTRAWDGTLFVTDRDGAPQRDGQECVSLEIKGFSSKLGEDRGYVEKGIIQAEEESSQGAVPTCTAMPGLGMCAHCQSDSLTPGGGREFLR